MKVEERSTRLDNMLSFCLASIFNELNDNVEYVVLRGYHSDDEIEEGQDVDIFVTWENRKKVQTLLENNGWHTPSINTASFPHEQFYHITAKKIYKIDVVYGLYYGVKMFHYRREKEVMENRVLRGIFFVPRDVDALTTLMCHIVFDKRRMDAHNERRFRLLYGKCQEISDFTEWDGYSCALFMAECIRKGKEIDFERMKKDFSLYFNSLLEGTSIFIRHVFFLKRQFKMYQRSLLYRIKSLTFAVVGVDGVGKSTLVEAMLSALGNRGYTAYMGFRDFKPSVSRNKLCRIRSIASIYFTFWQRYLRHRFKCGGIVIFDRFPYEVFICADGVRGIFFRLLYLGLFPSPTELIYVHCNLETSLGRKDDILDVQRFSIVKEKYDKFYSDDASVCYSSDEMCTDEIVSAVCELVNEKYIEFIV